MSVHKYEKLMSSTDVPAAELALAKYWDDTDTFRKSVESRPADKPYVFYEGPPTANGKPGVHHVIARLCKDLAARYKTMLGHRVIRKAGWDTHGLPVEIEVEHELGIEHKAEIEQYGVAEFNKKCRESVFRYKQDWVEFTRRIGYWLDMDHPYVTCENHYIESVWWILKEFWNRDLIYKGHKVVPYCPRCETSLSSHEVSQGYRDVSDPSIFVKFRRRDVDEYFLAWTTTPWTLISNVALAVGADYTYVRVHHNDDTLILAEALLSSLDGDYKVIDRFAGGELVGLEYEPLFPFYAGTEGAFKVVSGDHVSLEDGTGIVHTAPAFGEDDYLMHKEHGVPVINAVTVSGTFAENITPWAGKFIKDADPSIVNALAEAGKLYKRLTIKHSYPFCWRCDTPLIYYARESWYIQTTRYKDEMLKANEAIRWIPPDVGRFRFGNWLENNVDWSLSRERYWGTPLNIWECQSCERRDSVGSIQELRERATNAPEEIDLHRPHVDDIEIECECGGSMRRVSEVIDVWFDSGAMPFAQYHYPWDEEGLFESQYPADFISEGIDQCRGWFYSLLAISILLKGESPYKACLTTELILDKRGQKMSKSKGNTVAPWEILNEDGADALRWYMVTTSPPWAPTRFDRDGVKESSRKMLDTFRNVYSFFAMYAEIDGYEHDPGNGGEPNLLDRWLLSRYHSLVKRLRSLMDDYDVTRASRLLQTFTLDELSNWYVRRSRRRFWKGETGPDKTAAYHTLFVVLEGLSRLTAPFIPFLAEEVYLALHGKTQSVHLSFYPEADDSLVDPALESRMEVAMTIASLGRTVRNDAAVKVRQPLPEVLIHSNDTELMESFLQDREMVGIVLDELNVRSIRGAEKLESFVRLSAKPNFPALGKRFGKSVPDVAGAIKQQTTGSLLEFNRGGTLPVNIGGNEVELGRDELSVQVEPVDGYGASSDRGITTILNLEINEELRVEGSAREIINRLQNLRKSAGYEVTDRIEVHHSGGALAGKVFQAQGTLVATETLADRINAGDPGPWPDSVAFELDGEHVVLWIRKTG